MAAIAAVIGEGRYSAATYVQWPSVIFYGHSYIRRFGEFIKGSAGTKPDFGMQDMFHARFNFAFEGRGGATVASLRERVSALYQFDPIDILVLHVGDNEITAASDPYVLAESIVELAEFLQARLLVSQVVISQLFFRDLARYCNIETHNDIVKAVNDAIEMRVRFLSHSQSQHPCQHRKHHIVFWRHFGFGHPDVRAQLMHTDGVHFNDRGNFKLYRSFKSALVHAMKRLFA